MKKLFYAFFALGLFSVVAVSCSDDDDDRYTLSQGVGDIMSYSGSTMKILMDDMDTVLVTNAVKYDFKVGDRVAFAGEIISERKNEHRFYEFRAVVIDKVLTKKPLLQSELDADQNLADSVGNDRIEFMGDVDIASKYLNINFILLQGGIGIKHFINLVIDDVTPIEVVNGELVLNASFRQNANGDIPRYESYGFVSFDIEHYLSMEGVNKLKINIKYKVNDTTETIKTVEVDLMKSDATSLLSPTNRIDSRIFTDVI